MTEFLTGLLIVFAAFVAMVSIALWHARKRKLRNPDSAMNMRPVVISPPPAVADALGMDDCQSSADWIAAIEYGLSASAMQAFARRYGLSPKTLLEYINGFVDAPPYMENDTRLSPVSSDTLVRLAALYVRAENVLDGVDEARQWMQAPNFSLGNVAPAAYASTWVGTRAVENLLGQIEHGICA